MEYLVDIFSERRQVNKKEFLKFVASTMRNYGQIEEQIAAKYFDSIDLSE